MGIKTIIIVVGIGFCASCSHGAAQSITDCRKIADAAARLECFDKLKPSPKGGGQGDSRPAASGGNWVLQKKTDAMTDKVACVITPKGRPEVQVNIGSLYISYRGRGGVDGFTVRVDEDAPDKMQLPTSIDKQISVVHISGPAFNRVMGAKRLRVQTLTVVGGLITEDINLSGLSPIYAQMLRECPR